MLKHTNYQLVIVLTEPKNMLICHTIFHCELFVVYFLGWVQDPQLCWCWQVYAHCVTAWMTTCSLSVERLDTAGHVNFLFKHFIPLIFNCLWIVWKHLAQSFCSITLADLQTFYQKSLFIGKIHNLQTRKYDVTVTSQAAKNI